MPSQWERFKQSNIAKIVIGYSLVVWVLIQLIEAVLPTFETPLWVAQTLTFLLILGFPIALLVGWAYEKLPAQHTDTDGVKSEPQPAHSTPKKTLVFVGIGSCAVIGLFGFYMMPFIFDQSSFTSESNSSVNIVRDIPSYNSLRYEINLGNTRARGWGARTDITISPNGRTLVYASYDPPTQFLMLKDMTSFDEPTILTELTMNNVSGYPQFSNDGQWVFYHEDGTIKRIRVEGGTPQTVIASEAAPSGLAVRGQTLVYLDEESSSLKFFDMASEQATQIKGDDSEDKKYEYTWPYLFPDGRFLLATNGIRGGYADSSVDLIDLTTGDVREIIPVGYKAVYSESGHVIFARGEAIWAQPFDTSTMTVSGDAVPLIFDTEIYEQYGNVGYALSNEGRMVFVNGGISGVGQGNERPVFVSRNGTERELPIELANYGSPQLSPDNRFLSVMRVEEGGSDVWVYDIEAGTFGRRTFDLTSGRAIWSADGGTLFYQCENGLTVCTVASNGTAPAQKVFSVQGLALPHYETSSGSLLLSAGSNRSVFNADLNGNSETLMTNLALGPSLSEFAALSPDENWIAYSSNETGIFEVYVRPYPSITSGKWQISRNGGRFPMWSSNESELFWWNTYTNEINAAKYQTRNLENSPDEFQIFNPEQLFAANYMSNQWPPVDYNSTTDEFVFIKDTLINAEDVVQNLTHLAVIENWFDELKFLVPPSQPK
ncbi:MAG: hypothetical protein CBD51_003930 [Flavobacteriales bacterium TMED191]|nr:MAG: hypothetical protein CBD51_003930 [Flavobacteriales bacterium TMED191]